MPSYIYLKKPPRKKNHAWSLLLSSFFLASGIFLLGLVVWPILSFEILVTPKLSAMIISPLPQTKVLGEKTSDLIQAANWFPAAVTTTKSSKITGYTLSIPKLEIQDATVAIGGQNLSKSLIQWGGTALPGDFGTTVIFGHSVLPAFFNPKNYMTIFSTLPTLKEKDEIVVYFDGITYRYKVFEIEVVDPTDLSVFEQKFDDSYLSLITCVPPGTYWRRMIVTARLMKI